MRFLLMGGVVSHLADRGKAVATVTFLLMVKREN